MENIVPVRVHHRGDNPDVDSTWEYAVKDAETGKLFIRHNDRWWMLSNEAPGGWRSINVGYPDEFVPAGYHPSQEDLAKEFANIDDARGLLESVGAPVNTQEERAIAADYLLERGFLPETVEALFKENDEIIKRRNDLIEAILGNYADNFHDMGRYETAEHLANLTGESVEHYENDFEEEELIAMAVAEIRKDLEAMTTEEIGMEYGEDMDILLD